MKHVRTCIDLARRAFDVANKIGDFTFVTKANLTLNSGLLIAGDPLSDVQREAELSLAFAQKARFSGHIELFIPQLALIWPLRGLTPKFGCLDSEQIEELPFERHLASNPSLAPAECFYWIRKMQARYFAGDHVAAIEASSKAQRLLWTLAGFFDEVDYHFYTAMSRAAACASVSADKRHKHLETLALHQPHLDIWPHNCPENFDNLPTLLGSR